MSSKIHIICDLRERVSQISQELQSLSTDDFKVEIKLEQLSLGDYQLSEDVLVERKTIADLEASIIDGRIFNQIEELSTKVKKPCLIVEGIINFSENSNRINNKSNDWFIDVNGFGTKVLIYFTRNQKKQLFSYMLLQKENNTE